MADIKTITDISGNTYNLRDSTAGAVVVTTPSFSSLPQTYTDAQLSASITSDLVVTNSVLSNPSAQTGDWTITTNNGSLTITGSVASSGTTLTLYLIKER